MKLLTIGFAGKSAEQFFGLLRSSGVQRLIDVRRSNNTLFCGFTRARDLPFLLERLCGINYVHEPQFAPSEELLKDYQKQAKLVRKDPSIWMDYTYRYLAEIQQKPIAELFGEHAKQADSLCLLCTESTPEHCHRRLLAEYLKDQLGVSNVDIEHL